MDKINAITVALTGVCIDDSRYTPEHRLMGAVLLKAVQEARWKRVVITYIKNDKQEERVFFSRCNASIVYLMDIERDDTYSVLSICDEFDINYDHIKKLLNSSPYDFKDIEGAKFTLRWGDRNGWKLGSSNRQQIYGSILRNCMFQVKID